MTTAAAAPAEATAIRQFLRGVFAEDWRDALWTGFTGDPRGRARGDWAGWDLGRLLVPEIPRMPPTARMNMYFCPSLVTGRDRCLAGFRSFHVVVYDDYGTFMIAAGAPERLLGTPSYMIETSPGNFQAGWVLDPPMRELARVRRMLARLKEILPGDNLDNPVAWRRLPCGINGKPEYLNNLGREWRVQAKGRPTWT